MIFGESWILVEIAQEVSCIFERVTSTLNDRFSTRWRQEDFHGLDGGGTFRMHKGKLLPHIIAPLSAAVLAVSTPLELLPLSLSDLRKLQVLRRVKLPWGMKSSRRLHEPWEFL